MPTRLIKGGRGDFEVALDGEALFSKRHSSRFPDPGEITGLIAERLDGE